MSYRILTDMDSILDTRIGTLKTLLKPKGLEFEDIYGGTYYDRVLDKFDRPSIGITHEDYLKAFVNRGDEVFVNSPPTPLMKSLFNIIVTSENLMGKPITFEKVEISINTYPYNLDDELKATIKETLELNLGYSNSVNLVYYPHHLITSSLISSFNYVFMYHLLGKEHRRFQETFGETPNPDTRLGIPKVYLKEPDEVGLTPGDQLMRLGALWGVVYALLPIDLKFYNGVK